MEEKEVKEEAKEKVKTAKKSKKSNSLNKTYTALERTAAFYYYYQLGRERTLAKVSKKTHIPLKTLKDWSVKYHWRDKIKEQMGIIDKANAFKKNSSLASLSAASTYALYMEIINSKKATYSEKLKAAEKIERLVDKSAELKDYLKVAIRLDEINKDEIIKKLRDAGIPIRKEFDA